MKVRFCETCKRLILADFRFCPYCGEGVGRGPDLAESLETPFKRIEAASGPGAVGARIDELEARLDEMDVELELMLAARHEN